MRRLSALLIILILFSCSKDETRVISGNDAPEENLVTTELKENYINRLYINLAGRKADNDEFSDALNVLGDVAGIASREALIQQIFAKDDYKIKLYEDVRADYLESVDTARILRDYLTLLAVLPTVPPNLVQAFQEEIQRQKHLLDIPQKLDSNLIDIIEVHKRAINNQYYDDINMGTENFVVATFQNFLFRYPTDEELESASLMVEGLNSILFLEGGNSRSDFTDIFFDSHGYFEGQVITLFNRYVYRDPSTEEMLEQTIAYINDGDYQNIQLKILASDEYFFNEY